MKRRNVLLIEADNDDVFQFRCALKSVSRSVELHAVGNVAAARNYLESRSGFVHEENSAWPDLIAANLPLAPGSMDFLKWLQAHGDCKDVPVVIWSDQTEATFVDSAIPAGTPRFITKTLELAKLCSDIDRMLRHVEARVAGRSG